MTAKQKAARAKFKAVVAEAKKLRKKNPKLTQAQAVKQAFAISYSKKGTSKKVSGNKDFAKQKKVNDAINKKFANWRYPVPPVYTGNWSVATWTNWIKKHGQKIGAIKIVEKGESKKTKPKATYQQVRSKKGTFKGLKKVGNNNVITASNFTRISNDIYGNPRYVIHYLNINSNYEKAVKIANKIGGKKFNNKQYGGGIVFQSYNIDETARKLNEEVNKSKKIGATSKVKAKKRKSSEMHTDTKSHNVNIRVVSGNMTNSALDQANYLSNKIRNAEEQRDRIASGIKYKKYDKSDIPKARGMVKKYNQYIKSLKYSLKELKKHI